MTAFKYVVLLGLIVACGWRPTAAYGDITELASDRFGYTGSYTEYATLADAQSQTSSIDSGTVEQRDLSLYFANNSPKFYPNANYFLTAWYYTLTGPGYGYGNPNNTDLSFIQIANDPSQGLSPLIGTANAYWTSSALNQFTIVASGSNANGTNSAARFGDSGSANQAASATAGTFISYSLNATFSGLNTAVYNPTTGAYESTGDTAGMSVSGTFTGLFQNTSTTNPGLNGFYDINLTLNTTSWAYSNQGSLDKSVIAYSPSFFGASVIAPEPSSMTVVALVGLTLLGASSWRRYRARGPSRYLVKSE